MKLYFANTSPYARKVRMILLEKGMQDRVDMVLRNPFDHDDELIAVNPLSKIPALVTEDGQVIFDSPVICAYLDTLSDQASLIPEGPLRWKILTSEALTDGILDAAFAIVVERRREVVQQSALWLARWENAIARSIAVIERDLIAFEGELSLAQIGLGAALGYLDFRLPDLDWRMDNPNLTGWFDAFSRRPAMQQTHPSLG